MKKLKKSNNKILCGVCGGIAAYFGIDATIVRILLVILSCIWGSGIIIYIAAALIMPPADNTDANNDDVDNLKSANVDGEEDKKSKSASKATEKSGDDVPHSDSEFDSYFKK